MSPQAAAYGTWVSPITAKCHYSGLGSVNHHLFSDVYFAQKRPQEGGPPSSGLLIVKTYLACHGMRERKCTSMEELQPSFMTLCCISLISMTKEFTDVSSYPSYAREQGSSIRGLYCPSQMP
ncbi:hypothetical protein E1B28_012646 [Marasmius oreades]|uniref:Uncharacterized protein n=1 Tax=Marasmius oreades TaxID=181124 RepID=A0A9P7RS06_9AGAR|nr:uncharacterized protein E1B28_012646 [Marasmius oreades]KAG7088674.1 hypothetical protein E1B28_012646 [Marasmius oreades]